MCTRSAWTFVIVLNCLSLIGCDSGKLTTSTNEPASSEAAIADAEPTTPGQAAVDAPKTMREQILAALSAEIAGARTHFGDHPVAASVNEDLLTDEAVLTVAEAVLKKTKSDNLFSSAAVMEQPGNVLVSVSSLPLEEGNWEKSLVKFRDARFDQVSEHFAAQAAKAAQQSLADVDGFVHIYLGVEHGGDLVAAIGICGQAGGERSRPRQFPEELQLPDGPGGIETLPPKRCDIDTDGELIPPGEGYLLSADEVSESREYWNSLDPQTRAIMRQVIQTDASPWLVSEKHIGKFNVDKAKARQRAIEMWKSELDTRRP